MLKSGSLSSLTIFLIANTYSSSEINIYTLGKAHKEKHIIYRNSACLKSPQPKQSRF